MTAQNGNSSQALFRAAESYMDRYPEREPIVRNIIGIDAAMFVKMSGTESKSRTILQPGAKWLFGAFSLKDGSGTGIKGNAQVDEATINECQRFVNFFELLDATDGRNSADVINSLGREKWEIIFSWDLMRWYSCKTLHH